MNPIDPLATERATMEARGWTQPPGFAGYVARAPAHDGKYAIVLSVRPCDGQWVTDFGWSGVSFSAFDKYPTPEAAADEAEAWLARTLSAFRFPWLTVDNDHV